MPADKLRMFVFARHAESAANAAGVLNADPSQPGALTARGRTQARALGAQPAAATGRAPLSDSAFAHAAPYFFDKPGVWRATATLVALTVTAKPATTANPSQPS